MIPRVKSADQSAVSYRRQLEEQFPVVVLKSEKPVPNIAFFEHLARNQLRNVDDVKEEKKHHDHRQVDIFSNCEVNIAIPEYQRVGKPDYQSKGLESGVSVHPHIEKQAK